MRRLIEKNRETGFFWHPDFSNGAIQAVQGDQAKNPGDGTSSDQPPFSFWFGPLGLVRWGWSVGVGPLGLETRQIPHGKLPILTRFHNNQNASNFLLLCRLEERARGSLKLLSRTAVGLLSGCCHKWKQIYLVFNPFFL